MSQIDRSQRASNAQYHLGHKRFLELNGQLQAVYAQLDGTLASSLRMTADMVDTAMEMGLEPERGQKLFSKLATFSDHVIASRNDLIAAHLEATRIRMRTDQAVIADGCYPNPYKPSGENDALRVVA